jgi:hypothetical protein
LFLVTANVTLFVERWNRVLNEVVINVDTVIALAQNGTQKVVLRELEKLSFQSLGRNKVLRISAHRGHEAVVRLLVEKGADVEAKNKDGWTALYWAVRYGNAAMVRLLLENGAEVDTKDNYGRTALYRAVMEENEAVVQMLVGKGASINAKSDKGETVLYRARGNGYKAVVQLLGGAALHKAACFGYEAVVRLLVDKEVQR